MACIKVVPFICLSFEDIRGAFLGNFLPQFIFLMFSKNTHDLRRLFCIVEYSLLYFFFYKKMNFLKNVIHPKIIGQL